MMSRLSRTVSVLVALVICILSVAGVSAAPRPNERAKPIVVYFEDLEEDLAEYYTETCGFDVSVDAQGWFKIIPVNAAGKGRHQPQELYIYHIPGITFTSGDRSFTTPLDVGPDVYYLEDGVMMVAMTGRSTTGSGVIGRVVINLETGEVMFEAGRRVFDDIDAVVCEALTPEE